MGTGRPTSWKHKLPNQSLGAACHPTLGSSIQARSPSTTGGDNPYSGLPCHSPNPSSVGAEALGTQVPSSKSDGFPSPQSFSVSVPSLGGGH